MNNKVVEERIPFIRDDLFIIPDDPKEKPYLLGSKCKLCGRYFFPRKTVCYSCKEQSLEDLPLSRKGKLEAGTSSFIAPIGFEPPFIVGYIVLPEGVKFFTQLLVDGVPIEKVQEELKPGREVELVIEKIREDDLGNDVIGYKFKVL